MSILRGFFAGIGVYGKAAGILFSRKFWWFLFFPLLVLLLVFFVGQWLVGMAGDSLAGMVQERLGGWLEGIAWLQWLNGVAGFFVRILLRIVYFFLFVNFGGYLMLIVLSPVYSWLSERTEAFLSGREYPFSLKQLMWEILRGIGIALRNMLFQSLFTLLLLLFAFIPLVGLLSPIALFLISSYFYGFSFVDYAIERKRFNVKESVRYVNKNAGLVTGVGSVFALSLMLPWISVGVCSFVSLLSVVAGTVAIHNFAEDSRKQLNK